MDEPQKVNVSVQGDTSRLYDPIQGPGWAKLIVNMTFAGAVLLLFTWQFIRQSEQSDRVIEKMQTAIDRLEDRRIKEHDKEVARSDKQSEANDTRMREWIKSQGERQAIENEKIRLELKGVTEQMKLLNDRIRMSQNMER